MIPGGGWWVALVVVLDDGAVTGTSVPIVAWKQDGNGLLQPFAVRPGAIAAERLAVILEEQSRVVEPVGMVSPGGTPSWQAIVDAAEKALGRAPR